MRAGNRSTIVQLSVNNRSISFIEMKQVKWERAIVQQPFNYRSTIVQQSFNHRSLSFNDHALNWNKSNESRHSCNFRANYFSGTRGTFLILGRILGILLCFCQFLCFCGFYNHKRGRATRNSENEPGRSETLWKNRCQAIFWLKNFVRPSSVGSPQTIVPRKMWRFIQWTTKTPSHAGSCSLLSFTGFFLLGGGGGFSGTRLFQVALQTYTMWVRSSWSLCKMFVCAKAVLVSTSFSLASLVAIASLGRTRRTAWIPPIDRVCSGPAIYQARCQHTGEQPSSSGLHPPPRRQGGRPVLLVLTHLQTPPGATCFCGCAPILLHIPWWRISSAPQHTQCNSHQWSLEVRSCDDLRNSKPPHSAPPAWIGVSTASPMQSSPKSKVEMLAPGSPYNESNSFLKAVCCCWCAEPMPSVSSTQSCAHWILQVLRMFCFAWGKERFWSNAFQLLLFEEHSFQREHEHQEKYQANQSKTVSVRLRSLPAFSNNLQKRSSFLRPFKKQIFQNTSKLQLQKMELKNSIWIKFRKIICNCNCRRRSWGFVCSSRVSLLPSGPMRLKDVARESFGQIRRSSQLHGIFSKCAWKNPRRHGMCQHVCTRNPRKAQRNSADLH